MLEQAQNVEKIFIIGLPRTATTSICVAMLHLGYQTAHTAFTQACFKQAQVIGDTPVFCDYQQLDQAFPNSKFIYLTREPSLWLPSIKQLLQRMEVNIMREDGGFNPIMKRCFKEVFSPFSLDNISQDAFLLDCYRRHEQNVLNYFAEREHDLLTIDISHPESYQRLLAFLNISQSAQHGFEKINVAKKVRAWQDIKHQGKVESTNKGRIDKQLY